MAEGSRNSKSCLQPIFSISVDVSFDYQMEEFMKKIFPKVVAMAVSVADVNILLSCTRTFS